MVPMGSPWFRPSVRSPARPPVRAPARQPAGPRVRSFVRVSAHLPVRPLVRARVPARPTGFLFCFCSNLRGIVNQQDTYVDQAKPSVSEVILSSQNQFSSSSFIFENVNLSTKRTKNCSLRKSRCLIGAFSGRHKGKQGATRENHVEW